MWGVLHIGGMCAGVSVCTGVGGSGGGGVYRSNRGIWTPPPPGNLSPGSVCDTAGQGVICRPGSDPYKEKVELIRSNWPGYTGHLSVWTRIKTWKRCCGIMIINTNPNSDLPPRGPTLNIIIWIWSLKNLTSEVDPHSVRVIIFIMAVDP